MKKEDSAFFPLAPWIADRAELPGDLLFEEEMMESAKFNFRILTDQALTSAPRHRLADILPILTVNPLRDMYRAYHLEPAAGRLKKQQLIDSLLKVLTDAEELELFIMSLPQRHWTFFKDAFAAEEIKDDGYMIDRAQVALSQGYVYLFYHQGEFIYAVPDEVKAAYKLIDTPALHEHMEVRLLMDHIARAAVNLYGALSLEELADLLNEQNHNKNSDVLTADMLEFWLIGNAFYNADYLLDEGYLAACDLAADDDMEALDMGKVQSILDNRQGKPRYFPDIKTFLRYDDPDYYEETPQIKALEKELRQAGLSPVEAEDIVYTLHSQITQKEDIPQVLSYLEENGLIIENEQAADKVLRLIENVYNSTRLRRNFGHTPDELKASSLGKPLFNGSFQYSSLSEIARIKSLKDGDEAAGAPGKVLPIKKPGRNEPCPCGSGLKYKKCCGKNTGDFA